MKKILIVSSSGTFIERNSSLLRRNEFSIFSATDSVSAMGQLCHDGADLVLVDVNLQDMDGEQFCVQARESESCAGIKLVLVCRNEPDEFDRLCACGADALIAKPVKPLQLVKTVGQFLTVYLIRSKRVSLRVKVISTKDSVEFFCISHNISVTGMLVETEYFLEVGSIIQCIFTVPPSHLVECEGEVVRTARSLDGAHQYGIQFTSLNRKHRNEIDRYISSLIRSDVGNQPDSTTLPAGMDLSY